MLLNLYKYILKELIVPFLIGVGVSSFVLLMFQIVRLTEFFIVQGVSLVIILKLLFYMLVSFFPITIPISFLFSVLLTFNRMSSDSEVTALKASGISTTQLLIPVSVISVFISLLTFYVSFFDGPWGNKNAMNLIHKIGANKAVTKISEGFINDNIFDDIMIYTKSIDPVTEKMNNVFIYNGVNEDLPFVIRSSSASLDIDELTKRTKLVLSDGDIIFLDQEDLVYKKASFSKFNDLVYEGKLREDRYKLPPSMSYSEINRELERSKKANNTKRFNQMKVEFHRRFAVPIACVIFAFLGVGFGNTNRRNIRAGSGLLSFLILLSYWLLYISLTALGVKGNINPVLSAWIPNILFFSLSVYLIKKIN